MKISAEMIVFIWLSLSILVTVSAFLFTTQFGKLSETSKSYRNAKVGQCLEPRK